MHVIVLGAGLAGVTSAWYLRQAGHTVTVIERQPAAGLETSFANGGQISVSHPEPWANPGAPGQVLRWLGREDAPLLFRPQPDWRQWAWGLQFLMECLPGRARSNTVAIARLALHSRSCLHALQDETGLEYDRLGKGILHLFFTARDFSQAGPRAALLQGFGIRAEVLDPGGCRAVEPALAHCRDRIVGGLYAPEDESGDALIFTQGLAALCAHAGVVFHHGLRIESLLTGAGKVAAAQVVDKDGVARQIAGDAFLVALGCHSAALVRPLGDSLPIYPVKGYSVTLPLAEEADAPFVSITDESRRIVCSRLGNRLRIAGTAELAGYDASVNPVRCAAILRRAEQLFPRIRPSGDAEYWAGLRPATPGNVPVIGRGRLGNLYFNTGHGTLGWTLACGSGQVIADIIDGKPPRIDFPFLNL